MITVQASQFYSQLLLKKILFIGWLLPIKGRDEISEDVKSEGEQSRYTDN